MTVSTPLTPLTINLPMSIYVHIPFCRNKCFYCGFYSVASLQLKEAYVKALCREMDLRKDYLPHERVETLYFGGGTPSYLDANELEVIVNKIQDNWVLDEHAERSIEMNPEDVTADKLMALRDLGFNRLTIGIQSFNDSVLKRINRTHTAQQALAAVERAKAAGFDNIGIDLIIGLPGSDTTELEKDLLRIENIDISHVSVYILSIDSNSVFEKLSEKGKFKPQDDDILAEQYLLVSDYLKNIGYEHYEISNFAKDLKYSRHNTAYWQQKPYIGLGAAAHSFDLGSRQWNVANLKSYIDGLDKGQLIFEKEELTARDQFNEYLMTNFRTMWGIDPDYLSGVYPEWWGGIQKQLELYLSGGLLSRADGRIRMTERGWLVSDGIFSELFV